MGSAHFQDWVLGRLLIPGLAAALRFARWQQRQPLQQLIRLQRRRRPHYALSGRFGPWPVCVCV